MLGLGRVASLWGRVGSLASKNHGTALTQFPSTTLTDRELENSAELSLQELDSEELSQKELSSEELGQKELSHRQLTAKELDAAYCTKTSLQQELAAAYCKKSLQQELTAASCDLLGQTKARELQLHNAQLCKSHFAIQSLQQKELAEAYAFLAQSSEPIFGQGIRRSTFQ